MIEEYLYTNPVDHKKYHIVRGCIPTEIPIDKCGMKQINLQITVVQYRYEYSPFTETFLEKIIYPDIQWFYSSFIVLITFLAFIVAIVVFIIVKMLVSDPI
jgi:hypothetical protein